MKISLWPTAVSPVFKDRCGRFRAQAIPQIQSKPRSRPDRWRDANDAGSLVQRQQDAKVLAATHDDIAGKFSFPPRINRQGLRNAAELVAKNGTADLNLSQFVDETIIDELEREGFCESLKKK